MFALNGTSGLCKKYYIITIKYKSFLRDFASDYNKSQIFLRRGFPVWLKYVPGMAFRTDNEPFKV